MTLTDRYIDHLHATATAEIPDGIMREARKRLLDFLGAAIGGVTLSGGRLAAAPMLDPPELGKSTIIGTDRKSSPALAALINGFHGHVAEVDDGDRRAMMHPGAPVISALLAVAEQRSLRLVDVLRGIVVGYEAAVLLGRAMQPRLKEAGYHATGVCGTVGAALAITAALMLTRESMHAAVSAAATSAAGLLNVVSGRSELKPYNAGHAAQSGISAALVAEAGFSGSEDVLGAVNGMLSVFLRTKENALADAIPHPGEFLISDTYVKPYAACRHSHPAVEAALLIRARNRFAPREIVDVQVRTYKWAVALHDHTEITSVGSAKMSTPFSVAVALQTGRAGVVEFNDASVRDDANLRLTKLIDVEEDTELTAVVPEKRPAIVTVRLSSGAQYSERIDLPKGEPERPVSDEELMTKFVDLCSVSGMKTTGTNVLASQVLGADCESRCVSELLSRTDPNSFLEE